jgi:hypothetical protein
VLLYIVVRENLKSATVASESEKLNRYRVCPACGNFSHVLEEHYYCILCGTKLIDQCISCGTAILHPQGKFCHHCGAGYRAANTGTGQPPV